MPLYDYDCAACRRRFEVIHGVHVEGPVTCPLCGKGPVRKAITAPAVHYKGSGWAKKERRATAKSGASTSGNGRVLIEGRWLDLRDWRIVRRVRTGEGVERGVEAGRSRRLEADRLIAMPAATDWITLAEAAEVLAAANIRFTPATIGAWARAGRLQSIKLGGRRFVRRGEVRALVASPRRRVRLEDVQPVLFEDLGG